MTLERDWRAIGEGLEQGYTKIDCCLRSFSRVTITQIAVTAGLGYLYVYACMCLYSSYGEDSTFFSAAISRESSCME